MNRYRDAYIEACYIMMVHNQSMPLMSTEFDIPKILSYSQSLGCSDLKELNHDFYEKIKLCTQ